MIYWCILNAPDLMDLTFFCICICSLGQCPPLCYFLTHPCLLGQKMGSFNLTHSAPIDFSEFSSSTSELPCSLPSPARTIPRAVQVITIQDKTCLVSLWLLPVPHWMRILNKGLSLVLDVFRTGTCRGKLGNYAEPPSL